MATISDFTPGDDILQSFKPKGSTQIKSGKKFTLASIASSRGRTYSVRTKDGETSAILSMHEDHLMNNQDAKLNLALRQEKPFNKQQLNQFKTNGYFDSLLLEEVGDKAKQDFERKGFANRGLYFNHENKKDVKKFVSNMEDILAHSFDRTDVKEVLSMVNKENDWKDSNYPWLNVFETSLSRLTDMQ